MRIRSTRRLTLARKALAQRCEPDNDWSLSRYDRLRLAAKAVICVLLLPRRSLWAHGWGVEVAVWDVSTFSSQDGTFTDWTSLVVTKGWRRWAWDYYQDGT